MVPSVMVGDNAGIDNVVVAFWTAAAWKSIQRSQIILGENEVWVGVKITAPFLFVVYIFVGDSLTGMVIAYFRHECVLSSCWSVDGFH